MAELQNAGVIRKARISIFSPEELDAVRPRFHLDMV
jgi:hypothetical protein